MPSPLKPLWHCSKCGRAFAIKNQAHSCVQLELEHHFEGKEPALRELFAAFLSAVENIGAVKVLPEKTRIAFQTRMSFAQLTPRKSYFVGHLILAEPSESLKFVKVETISPRNHVHHFKLDSTTFLDAEFQGLLAQAYVVGNQEHLRRLPPRASEVNR
jgi:hypothetical protein